MENLSGLHPNTILLFILQSSGNSTHAPLCKLGNTLPKIFSVTCITTQACYDFKEKSKLALIFPLAMSSAVSVPVQNLNIKKHWYTPLMGRVNEADPLPIDVFRKMAVVNMFAISLSNFKHFAQTLFK